MLDNNGKNRDTAMAMTLHPNRLESPSMTGYRAGMNSSCIIGRKLGVLFDIPLDMPSEVDELLKALDMRLSLECAPV